MEIKVLGTGCANCHALEAAATEAAAELGLNATVEMVTDYAQILGYGVMSTPGLVIDGAVVVSGRVPSKEEIKGWLADAG
jgi:small redox-active disulfide protein 2